MKLANAILAASVAGMLLSVSPAWAAGQPAAQPTMSPAPAASATPMQSGMPAQMPMTVGKQMPMMMCPMMGDSMTQMMQMHAGMGGGMMGGMSDQNFVVMTIIHDQMMVQMAKAELQNGKDVKVKAAARSIIGRYTSEIAQLRSLIAAP